MSRDILVDPRRPPCVIWWHCCDLPPPTSTRKCHILFEWALIQNPKYGCIGRLRPNRKIHPSSFCAKFKIIFRQVKSTNKRLFLYKDVLRLFLQMAKTISSESTREWKTYTDKCTLVQKQRSWNIFFFKKVIYTLYLTLWWWWFCKRVSLNWS